MKKIEDAIEGEDALLRYIPMGSHESMDDLKGGHDIRSQPEADPNNKFLGRPLKKKKIEGAYVNYT